MLIYFHLSQRAAEKKSFEDFALSYHDNQSSVQNSVTFINPEGAIEGRLW